jgi:hypothetical protein
MHYCHLTGNIDLNLSLKSVPNNGDGLALLLSGWTEGYVRKGLVTQRTGGLSDFALALLSHSYRKEEFTA